MPHEVPIQALCAPCSERGNIEAIRRAIEGGGLERPDLPGILGRLQRIENATAKLPEALEALKTITAEHGVYRDLHPGLGPVERPMAERGETTEAEITAKGIRVPWQVLKAVAWILAALLFGVGGGRIGSETVKQEIRAGVIQGVRQTLQQEGAEKP